MSGFTFNRGHATIDPDIQTPYVNNWTVGYQRELWRNAALEIRYVGNRGNNLWRSYDLNEMNIIENGFLDDSGTRSGTSRSIVANGRTGFANQGLPGQVAAADLRGRVRPARLAAGASPAASGFTNGTFITQLQQGQAGGSRTRSRGLPLPLPDGRQRPAWLRDAAATTRRRRTRSTSSRPTRSRPAAQCGC